MTWILLTGLIGFAFVSSITPGPNNIMLMASGASFGIRRTLPHLAGVSLGFGAMALVIGLGLVGILAAVPVLFEIIRWVGAAYLLYLAVKIAASSGIGSKPASGRPMTFWQAVAFQWVNPKCWAMGLGAMTTYAEPGAGPWSIALVALVFTLVNAPCVAGWATFGLGMKRLLRKPAAMRAFNVTMGLLLVLSLFPFLTETVKLG